MADLIPDLILLPTLERLRPHDDTAARRTAFGLTLSVALADGRNKLADLGQGEALGRALLQPWTWKPEKELRPEGDAAVEISEVLFYSIDPAYPGASRRLTVRHEDRIPALDRPLEDRFEMFEALEKRGGTPWSWAPQEMSVDRESRPWPGFVGQLSQYPYPLPQALRLSFFLELDQDLGSSVIAAPILRFRRDGKIIELLPQAPVPFNDRFKLEYKWPEPEPLPPVDPAVVPAPPPPPAPEPVRPFIEAQTVACATTVDLASAFFDFEDLWIKQNPPKSVTNAEWRAGLELRMAEQLHLSRAIADWMKENRGSAALTSRYPEVVWAAIQKLRLVLGPGLRTGPDGSFLKRAGSFLEQLPQPFPESAIDALRQKAATFFSLDDAGKPDPRWAGWLREAVSGLKGGAGSGLLDAAVAKDPVQAIANRLSFEQTRAELDQLLASVAEPETLRSLFKIQWTALVADRFPSQGNSDEEKLARALAAGLPPEVDLQRLLLLDHLGRHWETLKEAFAGSPQLQDVRERLKTRYMEILQAEKIPLMSDADLKPLLDRFVELVLPEKLDDVEPRGTRGLTFQVDTLGRDDQGAKDLLQHMQGVALLMRRKDETDYHCLNLAAARIGETVIDPVLVPSRLAYVNDLRSPTVTYDNGPLTVAGPLGAAVVAGAELFDARQESSGLIDEPLLELTYSSKGRIPGLIFKKSYQALPFLVTNSGALPKELAVAGKPWKLKEKIPQLTRTPLEEEYLRETHIGALRFSSSEASGLPPLPPHVAPQIRELPPEKVLPPGDPLLNKDKDLQTDAALAGTPLLLLTPPGFPGRPGVGLRNQLKFQISPPTLDLQTWDRWMATDLAGEAGKNRRKFVWRSFYQLAHDKGLADRKLEEAGVYLDDPAVAGIWAELVRIGEDGTRSSLGIQKMDRVPKPPPFNPANPRAIKPDFSNWQEADCTLLTEQHASIPVECLLDKGVLTVKLGPAGAAQKTLSGTGRLFCLSFYAFMKAGDEARFSSKGDEEEYVRTDVTPRGTSPWHLLIEIPQELPKDPAGDLRKALLSVLTPDAKKAEAGKLAVALDLNESRLGSLKGLIYRAEIWHQVWHWRGRPPAEGFDRYPQENPGSAFEMSEFGPRSDDGHRRLPMPRQAVAEKPEPVFLYEEDLDHQGPLGDRRALAHRFSARVFSRWEGILPEEQSSLEAIDPSTQVRWKPHFVPCRHQGEVPAPKIRMVLPLTEGVSEKVEDGPGLLVVVDGPWYEVGGLAERLGIEVMTVSDPAVKTGELAPADQQYFQIGTDPIFTTKSAGEEFDPKLRALSLNRFSVGFSQVDGAIGHHRDHSPTDPRFLASSFLLSRPTISFDGTAKPVDLSWWFLKLRFRRELTIKGQKDSLASEWSAPFWVQVLPGVERVEEDWLGEGMHEVRMGAKGLEVTGVQQRGPRNGFHLFAVMTRKVLDFAGRPDQEVYLGLWSWNPSQRAWSPDPLLDTSTKTDLFVRFIEVQSKKAPSPEALWDRIFKADQADSERARIVRISKRFPVNGGAQ